MNFAERVWDSIPASCRPYIRREDVLLAVNHAILFNGTMKTTPKTSAPRGMWYGRFLDKQSDIFSLIRALQPIGKELEVRGLKKFDDTWNPDSHVEITLRVRECRMIQELLKKHEIPAEKEQA